MTDFSAFTPPQVLASIVNHAVPQFPENGGWTEKQETPLTVSQAKAILAITTDITYVKRKSIFTDFSTFPVLDDATYFIDNGKTFSNILESLNV